MSFNRELAQKIIEGSDRNIARFFAGREREIESFRHAVTEATEQRQTAFRIFTGAPGCGKSSLLEHIVGTHEDVPELLFVPVGQEELRSMDALLRHIVDTALHSPNRGSSARVRAGLGASARAVAEFLKARTFAEAVLDWQQERALDQVTVVLQIDEAQNLKSKHLSTLAELHANGLPRIRSVALIAGLPHTKDRLDDAGISRTARNADVDMGAMAPNECAESTLAMFDELRVVGSDGECTALAHRMASSSMGWPQHLNRAQEAVCKMLLPANGAVADADLPGMDRLVEQGKAEHYARRIEHRAFGHNPALVQRILITVDSERVETDEDLLSVCHREIEASGSMYTHTKPDLLQIAAALERRGVIAHQDGLYVVPIPSMVTWAKEQLRERAKGPATGPTASA